MFVRKKYMGVHTHLQPVENHLGRGSPTSGQGLPWVYILRDPSGARHEGSVTSCGRPSRGQQGGHPPSGEGFGIVQDDCLGVRLPFRTEFSKRSCRI